MKTRTMSTVSWERYLIDDGSNPRIKKFLESKGNDIFNQIAQNVHKAYIRKNKNVVFVIHPHISNAIVINESEYLKFLNVALEWFTRKENYEQCAIVKSYIDNQLNTTTKKRNDKVKNNVII